MSYDFLTANNPFFKHDIDKLCIICSRQLKIHQTPHSIFERLEETQSKLNVYEALQSITNFKEIELPTGAEKVCEICFKNTTAASKFHEMCNKSASYLKSYMQYQEINSSALESSITSNEINVEGLILPKLNASAKVLSTYSTTLHYDDVQNIALTTIATKEALNRTDETPTFVMVKNVEKIIMPTTTTETLKSINEAINHEEQITIGGVRKVKCKVCNTFFTKKYMPYHVGVHTGERPYSCDKCGKTFKSYNGIWVHKKVHTEYRKYLCTICGKSFKHSSYHVRHVRQHSNERPHECEVCAKTFREARELKEHYIVHTGERPFACEQCGKCFPFKKYLRQHMNSHLEVKRHECHLCGKRFTQRHSLKTHLSQRCKTKTN